MIAVLILGIITLRDEVQDGPKRPTVFARRTHTEAQFDAYVRRFEIDPKKASELVRAFWVRLPEEARPSLGPLVGVVDNEYTFSLYRREVFPMTGYRVDVHTGRVRIVTHDGLLKKYGDPFYGGIPNKELTHYEERNVK